MPANLMTIARKEIKGEKEKKKKIFFSCLAGVVPVKNLQRKKKTLISHTHTQPQKHEIHEKDGNKKDSHEGKKEKNGKRTTPRTFGVKSAGLDVVVMHHRCHRLYDQSVDCSRLRFFVRVFITRPDWEHRFLAEPVARGFFLPRLVKVGCESAGICDGLGGCLLRHQCEDPTTPDVTVRQRC